MGNFLDVLSLMGAILEGGPKRQIDRTEVGGVTVSTVDTVDLGLETAICDAVGAHPVEHYETEEQARAGHAAWVARAPELTTIRKLGYGTTLEAEDHTLVREKVVES